MRGSEKWQAQRAIHGECSESSRVSKARSKKKERSGPEARVHAI